MAAMLLVGATLLGLGLKRGQHLLPRNHRQVTIWYGGRRTWLQGIWNLEFGIWNLESGIWNL